MNNKALSLPANMTVLDQQQTTHGLSRWEKLLMSVLSALQVGCLNVQFSSGRIAHVKGKLSANPEQSATIEFKNHHAISRVLKSGPLGFAEGYLNGDWDTPDLMALLDLLVDNQDQLKQKINRSWFFKNINRLKHLLNRNTKAGSRRNIAYHYDLGNDFYELWLDKTMTYSAAVFAYPDQSLEEAQIEKYARLADSLNIQPGDHLLEIGCGWGGFAEYVTREYGCQITCVTLSKEQLKYAEERIEKAGLSELCHFKYQDYRDIEGKFDHIVSIEMFEAVGEEHWDIYFRKLQELLKPGGRVALQIITIANDRFESYRQGADFIQKYIFPGGLLPSPEKLHESFKEHDLALTDQLDIGVDYADTLNAWRVKFEEKLKIVSAMGYNENFIRMWRYYLCYCEAGFRAGVIDVSHFYLQSR